MLRQGGFSFTRATSGETISRPMRRALTTALELQGGRRVPGVVINRLVRQRLMDGVGGGDRAVRQQLFRRPRRSGLRLLGRRGVDH